MIGKNENEQAVDTLYLLMQQMFDKTVRIENMTLLAGVLCDLESVGEGPEEFLSRMEPEDVKDCFPGMPSEYVEEFCDGQYEAGLEWLLNKRKMGFLIQFATPVMEPVTGGGRSFSWGLYRTKCVYADTLEDAVAQALKWADDERKREDAEEEKKKKGEDQE